jgi:hypothetical protein
VELLLALVVIAYVRSVVHIWIGKKIGDERCLKIFCNTWEHGS